MKLFLIKSFKIFILFYILLWVLQFVVDSGLRNNNNDVFDTYNKIYNSEINADLIFFGTSRTLRHYDPKIFNNKLDLKSYNLGTNGTHYDSQLLKQTPYFKYNKKPKIIVQNVDIISLFKTEELSLKEQYFPYYTLSNYKLLSSFDNNITIEYMLPMYKYRGYYKTVLSAFEGHLSSNNNPKNVNGYIPDSKEWSDRFDQILKKLNGKKFTYNHINFEERFSVFYKLIEDLKHNSDYVFMVWAPEYIGRQVLEEEKLKVVKNKYIQLANKDESLFFIDFTMDSICNTKTYFIDSNHLNKQGAEIFSNKVADSIKRYLKLKN